MPIVAVTDHTFESLDVEEAVLEPLGCRVNAWKDKRSPKELAQLVADADAVLTQFAPLTAEVIAAMTRARVIVRYGVGVDNVDLDAARAKGIPVCNVPDYCIDEVADHTLAFILATTRQVVPNCLAARLVEAGDAPRPGANPARVDGRGGRVRPHRPVRRQSPGAVPVPNPGPRPARSFRRGGR
jgi:lactate dehydrogenase-like 2-hydroxyacid dehydrogenase